MQQQKPATVITTVLHQIQQFVQSRQGALSLLGLTTLGIMYKSGLLHKSFTVPHGYAGIIVNSITGVKQQVYTEGVHSCLKHFESVVLFEIRPLKLEVCGLFKSQNKKPVGIDCQVLYQLKLSGLPKLYRTYGTHQTTAYSQELQRMAEDITKDLVSEYDALDLATARRTQFAGDLEQRLKKLTQEEPAVILNLDLTEVILSKDLMEQLQ